MDTKSLYHKNLIERYDDLRSNGWINNYFVYKFNSHGFRCDEFADEPSIMFLGCSFTCGIGLPIEQSWTSIVAASAKLRCVNLGIGGSSLDTAFRMCYGYLKEIKPSIVILLEPPENRFELITAQSVEFLHVHCEKPIYKYLTQDDQYYEFNRIKNIKAIESLCLEANIRFMRFNSSELTTVHPTSLARDLAHPGTLANELFANIVLSRI